jgi:hypothetical protein
MESNLSDIIHSAAPACNRWPVFSVGSFLRGRKGRVLPLLRMTNHESAPLRPDSDTSPSLLPCSLFEI